MSFDYKKGNHEYEENFVLEQDLTAGFSDEELFSVIDHSALESEKITAPRYSYWSSVFRVFFKKKINIILLGLLAVIVIMSYVYPACIEYDKFANLMNEKAKHLKPGPAMEMFGRNIHWILGSGASGESTFDAIWVGARISLSLAFIVSAINMTIGVILGSIWGFSKKFDLFMTVIYQIIVNVPYLLIIAVLVLIFSPSFWTIVFAFTITGWLGIAYFLRTQVLIIRDREYNLASKCLGTSTFKIAMRNILPFLTSVIVTQIAAEIPGVIGMEVYLSYISLGMSDTSLGKMISIAEPAMSVPGWQFEFWSPVAVVGIISIVLYVVGQNLGDASDPRTHM